jgi:conjugal transfer/entry exclusion protein
MKISLISPIDIPLIPLVERKRGVVSNLSCPPGLLMSDVHAAESCAGAAVVLQSSNEVLGWMENQWAQIYKSIYPLVN